MELPPAAEDVNLVSASPGATLCCWDAGCLELGAGRGLRGGHDLHVLCEDGLKGLVSVDHGTKHQWLQETDRQRLKHLGLGLV